MVKISSDKYFLYNMLYAVLILVLYPLRMQALEINICVNDPFSGRRILESIGYIDRMQLNCMDTVVLNVARGERESASVIIESDADINNAKFSVTDLINISTNEIIPSSFINLKYVKVWYQADTAWNDIRVSVKEKILVPELLLNDDSLIKVERNRNYIKINNQYLDISSDVNENGIVEKKASEMPIHDSLKLMPTNLVKSISKRMWITINVPNEAKSGDYRGTIDIMGANNSVLKSVPLHLRIYPFSLVEPILEYSLYYRGVLTADNVNTISSEGKSDKQMLSELINMKEHGVSNPTVYQPYTNISKLERVFQLREQAGISNETIYYLGMNTGNFNDQTDINNRYKAFKSIFLLAKKYGMKSFYVYGIDEADKKYFTGQYPLWKHFHDLGGKIFVADWRNDRMQYISGKVDLFVSGSMPDISINKAYKGVGTKVFLYNRPQVGAENPEVYRFNYGLMAWKNGFDGVMNYAYQHSFGFIWNDFDNAEFRDHVFAYPTSDGVIDTIAWEGFREGVDDVKYLSTLIYFVNKSDPAKTINARKLVEDIHESRTLDIKSIKNKIADSIVELCCYKGQLN